MTIAPFNRVEAASKSYGPFFLSIPSVATVMLELASSAAGQPFFSCASDYPGNWDMWFGRLRLVIDPPETTFNLGHGLNLLAYASLVAWAFV